MKILPIIAFGMLPVAAMASLNVSTEPQKRVAVLEEFTGLNCVSCPAGHALAARVAALQPDLFVPVSVHSGSYAVPHSAQPDYRTDFGDELCRHFSVTFFPAGMVNRVAYGDGKVLDRKDWANAAREITAQESPLNLGSAAEYDAATRKLTVEVEGYFTSECSAMDDLSLNVMLLESGVVGVQRGVENQDSYIHNHMLRAVLTPQWGEVVGGGAAGQSFTRKYEYTVPEKFRRVDCDPEGLHVVVTAAQGSDMLLTAATCFPQSDSFSTAAKASLSQGRIEMDGSYGFKFVDVQVASEMIPEITALTFTASVNGGEVSTYEAECSIGRHRSGQISVPLGDFEMKETGNTATISLVAINGEAYDGADPVTVEFDKPAASYGGEFVLKIHTDSHASDNRFMLRDADGNIVREFGPYADGVEGDYTEEFAVENAGMYCIEVTDNWGDGFGSKDAYVTLCDGNGNVLAQNTKVEGCGSRMFFSADPSLGLGAIENAGGKSLMIDRDGLTLVALGGDAVSVEVYSADGTLVAADANIAQLAKGLYIAVARFADGTTATLKFDR